MTLGNIIFVVGGAGSGKSRFAISLAESSQSDVTFVATCDPQDTEMAEKVKRHKAERPKSWQTLELFAAPFLTQWNGGNQANTLVVDSVTIWVSALLLGGETREKILKRCEDFTQEIQKHFQKVVIVSDETGLGIVPENPLARNFRETLGQVNQQIARVSQETYLVVAGVPVTIKNNKGEK